MIQRCGPLDERLDIKVLLQPLSAEETAEYVAHRLTAAGASREIFSADGLEAVHQLSAGLPRRINRLCDLALLVGFANGQHTIDADTLRAIHDELVAVPAAA
jgi:general secretion pathway protein A